MTREPALAPCRARLVAGEFMRGARAVGSDAAATSKLAHLIGVHGREATLLLFRRRGLRDSRRRDFGDGSEGAEVVIHGDLLGGAGVLFSGTAADEQERFPR